MRSLTSPDEPSSSSEAAQIWTHLMVFFMKEAEREKFSEYPVRLFAVQNECFAINKS